MKEIILVGSGGFMGSILRYFLGQFITFKSIDSTMPYGTLAVNLIGSLLIGLLFGYGLKDNENWKLLLITGFCGGFTTFSTFAYENMRLLQHSNYLSFIIYTSLSIVGGLSLCVFGFWLTKNLS